VVGVLVVVGRIEDNLRVRLRIDIARRNGGHLESSKQRKQERAANTSKTETQTDAQPGISLLIY
jgi:hypothetical protein